MNDPIVVTRTLVRRAWADVEPKVQWAFASGAAASFLLELAHAYGIALPPIVTQETPYILAILAGYIMPSVGQTVTSTKRVGANVVHESEAHTGNAVSVVTGSVPVQPTAVAPTVPGSRRASFTDVVQDTPRAQDERPTEVIPGSTLPRLSVPNVGEEAPEPSSAARFLSTLPSAQANATGPQSIDGH